jgi:hypothetical protein
MCREAWCVLFFKEKAVKWKIKKTKQKQFNQAISHSIHVELCTFHEQS